MTKCKSKTCGKDTQLLDYRCPTCRDAYGDGFRDARHHADQEVWDRIFERIVAEDFKFKSTPLDECAAIAVVKTGFAMAARADHIEETKPSSSPTDSEPIEG